MRDTQAKCRKCRREGEKLFLKGERCTTQKCAMVKRSTPPGQGGLKGQKTKLSEYGKQLREKQKTKRIFGISEKTFHNYYTKATQRKGVTGQNLLILLETRLDNVIYRAGFADSRSQARQMVSHGSFQLNGKKVDVSSISVRPEDKINLREASKNSPLFTKASERKVKSPNWLKVDNKKIDIEVMRLPEKDELEQSIAINLIIEFYSR